MSQSSIEWTEMTWNPTTGCTKVSQGCKYCYAEVMAKRLQAMGLEKYRNAFELTLHPNVLEEPYKWKKPKIVFVNSMSDLFHKDVPKEFIRKVFRTMQDNPRHIFQLLTKRPEIMLAYDQQGILEWTPNIWMGVSVEDSRVTHRIDLLQSSRAHLKFLSCEPLIGPLDELDLTDIDWVIVGGESGPKARYMAPAWVESIRRQCSAEEVAFFFKQWGGKNKKKSGRLLNGRTYDEMPVYEEVG